MTTRFERPLRSLRYDRSVRGAVRLARPAIDQPAADRIDGCPFHEVKTESIAMIAEIAGTLAVVLPVIYLAQQINDNTKLQSCFALAGTGTVLRPSPYIHLLYRRQPHVKPLLRLK